MLVTLFQPLCKLWSKQIKTEAKQNTNNTVAKTEQRLYVPWIIFAWICVCMHGGAEHLHKSLRFPAKEDKYIHPAYPHLWLQENTDSCVGKRKFLWFVRQHNCACRGACRSHMLSRQYKRRTDAASAVQWALTTWNYSLCSWKVPFYSFAPGNGNRGWGIY